MEPDLARERLILAAKRKALVDGARRARLAIPAGVLFSISGLALAYLVRRYGLLLSILVGGVGLVMLPLGIAIVARAVTTIGTARKQVRALDASAIPAARVVVR
ncbi:MAG: hypothetical protein WKG01_31130 [Kofleriaceae bacterium]